MQIGIKPVFGGHDGLVVKPKPGIKNYVKIFGPAYYSWNYAGVHFIALISEPYFASPSFFKQQWTWVKKDLAQISATVPVIITTHDINPQAHELKKIESSHNLIALLCGHRHINHHYKAGKTAIFFSGPWRDYDWGANTNRVRIISWQGGKLKSRTSVLWNNADVKLSGAKVVRHKIKLNWPNFSGQSGARASAANITLPLELAWVINTGSYQPFFGSPVIVNGKIYYGVTDGQADFKNSGVICLNAKTGQQIWKTSIPGDFYSTVLLSDKYVFAMNAVGSCFALDANTGKIYWRTDPSPCKNYLKQYSYRLALAPLSFYNGTLFAVYNSGIMAISADTGKLLWQNNSFVARNYPIAGVAAGKQNIYGETQHELFALNQKDGSLRWCKKRKDLVHNIKRERAIATPAYVDNAVYFSARKTLRKLDRNGKEIWSTETNGMGLNYLSSPAIHNNKTVFAYDRFITCMDATSGQILWKFTCRTPKQAGYGAYQTIMNGASPVIADGKVFCGSDDGYLYILDLETGKKLQEIQIGSPIKASVAISNNFICISDFNGKIYAFSH